MARCAVFLMAVLMLVSCGNGERAAKPLSEPGEKVYELAGKIVARDAADNTLRIEHGPVPGFMEAMTMDFSVRGVEVGTLPADGSQVGARLHVTERAYWLTDVKQSPK